MAIQGLGDKGITVKVGHLVSLFALQVFCLERCVSEKITLRNKYLFAQLNCLDFCENLKFSEKGQP